MRGKPPPPPPAELAAVRLALGDTELVVFEWPEEAREGLPSGLSAPVEDGPTSGGKGRPGQRSPLHLSPRETVVAGFLARGYQNLQIAANLGVSVHTIRHQVASILRKTGTFNRTDFAAWWHAQK